MRDALISHPAIDQQSPSAQKPPKTSKKTRLGKPQPWLRELSDKGESVYQQICEARIEDVGGILDEYLGAPLEESLGESSQQQQKLPPSQQGVHMGELRIIIKSLGDRDQNCDSDSDSDWKKALEVFEFARKRPEFEHEGKGMLSAILKILGKLSLLLHQISSMSLKKMDIY